MGATVSKRYFSLSFDPISTKLYDKYVSHGGYRLFRQSAQNYKKYGPLKSVLTPERNGL